MGRGEHFIGRHVKPTHTGIVFTYQAKDFAGKDVTFVNTQRGASFVWIGMVRREIGAGEEITVYDPPRRGLSVVDGRRREVAGVTHVVALSGGKDSTAMALRLAEIAPRDYTYICTPTGDEPEEMFAHWRRLGRIARQAHRSNYGRHAGGLNQALQRAPELAAALVHSPTQDRTVCGMARPACPVHVLRGFTRRRGEALETLTGHTFRSPSRDTWPAAMKDLRVRFEAGDVPKETRRDAIGELKCRVCRQ